MMTGTSLTRCLAEIKARRDQYYVYVLRRPGGEPFYIGYARSGSNIERLVSHMREATSKDGRRPRNLHKLNVIRSLLRQGLDVQFSIDSWHSGRVQAASREVELIADIGRRDIGTGPLTNMTGGGDGPTALSAKGLERWREAAARGRAKAAIWRANNPEKLRELGRHVGAKRAQWMKDHPEEARLLQSRAGSMGIKRTHGVIKANAELRARMSRNLAERNKKFAVENPEICSARGKIAASRGFRKWALENPETTRAAIARGNAKNVERWNREPEFYAEMQRRAAEGNRRYARENPELVRSRMAHLVNANKAKAATRQRCISLIRDHGIKIALPSGRKNLQTWVETEVRIKALISAR